MGSTIISLRVCIPGVVVSLSAGVVNAGPASD
jgi:hypothetical protein